MEKLRLSFILIVALCFLCTVDSNPISNLFGKSDDKAEADEKEVVTTAKLPADATTTTTTTTTASTPTTTTTTPSPDSSCGGLKGFLHLCEKSEPTEPPKSVKARSVIEEDNDSDESDSEEDEKKKDVTETSVANEPTEGVVKRQVVEDSEAPILGEVPPMVGDAMSPPIVPPEEENGTAEKRQVDDSGNEEEKTDEVMGESRKRRDCRDHDGDYVKDCRKKREYVPCVGINCGVTTEGN